MQAFTWIDNVIMGVIAFSVLLGAIRGFVRESMSLITWVTAITIGILFCEDVASWFTGISIIGVRLLVAFLLIALIVLICGGILNHLISKIISTTRFTLPDRIVGILFGFARGCCIIAITILILQQTPVADDKSWQQTLLIPKFEPIALWLKDRFPQDLLKQYMHPMEKDEVKTQIEKIQKEEVLQGSDPEKNL